MLARSIRKPLVVGLGTGLVLVMAIAVPVFADAASGAPGSTPSGAATESAVPAPTDSPTTPPSPTPAPKRLYVVISGSSTGAVHAGSKVTLTVRVSAGATPVGDVRLSVGAGGAAVYARCTLTASGLCKLGTVDQTGQPVDVTITVPSAMTSGTVTVVAEALAGDLTALSKPYRITVTKGPKPTASPKPKSSSGAGAGSGGAVNPPPPLPGAATSAAPAPSTAPQDGTTLPGISDQSPSTVPLVANAGNAQSMRGIGDGPDQLTFEELASTQAAWLAALLVAFFLLITQIRLGRANARPRPAAQRHPKRHPRGMHRRTRDRLRGLRTR